MKNEILRIKRNALDLEKLIISKKLDITDYKIHDDMRRDGYTLPTDDWHYFHTREIWKCRDQHRWFRTTITIPDEYDEGHVEFIITTGREGQWDACNPQFLFYVDKQLIQGCDINHRSVLISKKATAQQTYDIAFLAYGGTAGDDLLITTSLHLIDKATKQLWYDITVPLEAAEILSQKDPNNSRKIIEKLAPAIDRLDLRSPYSETYYDSVNACIAILKENFFTETMDEPVVSAIGNTHIDVAWLWTVEQTKEKVLRSFSTVIELMNSYPNYKFIGSQPILYQFVKEQDPILYEKIKEKICEGRWEVDGAMWLEADCNLPSGESFVRQILKGEQFFKEEFGIRSKTLWLPDVFGYSAALPQILKQFDIPYFVTTKIAWNQYNQLPNDTFKWRGLDGSEVFSFMPTTSNYDSRFGDTISFTDRNNTTTYTGIIGPNMLRGTYERFQNKDLTDNTLMLYGYGDGGGGPTKDMLEKASRLKFGLPGIPRIDLEFSSDYLQRTYAAINHLPDMPTWDGELYFEYHRGVLTSNASMKKWNRQCERLVNDLEIMNALNYLYFDKTYHKEAIDRLWDIILLNQFHDIIPGTSIKEVYDVAEEEYAEIYALGIQELEKQLLYFTNQIYVEKDCIFVFNTLPFVRKDIVEVEVDSNAYTHVHDGTTSIDIQYVSANKIRFVSSHIEPFGYTLFQLMKKEKEAIPLMEQLAFENDFYSIVFNANGEIVSLIEKSTSIELINPNNPANILMTYEDRPANWDNWDVDIFYQKKKYPADTITQLKMIENGLVYTIFEVTHQFVHSTIHQQIILYRDLPRIDFKHTVDWQENNLLLRALFPTVLHQTKATFDIQFGCVERETTNNNSWDLAKFESCAHKWVDLSNNSVGLSVLNDCKYGHSVKENMIGISLIKSGTYPNKDADIGYHSYTYSLYPHSLRWVESETIEQANNLNAPLKAIQMSRNNGITFKENSIKVISGSCFIDTLKRAETEDAIIMRVYENKNKYGKVLLQLPQSVSNVVEVNLREEDQDNIPMTHHMIEFTLKPFEIKSFKLSRSK